MDVHLNHFLFHQGKKICILLKHQNERGRGTANRPHQVTIQCTKQWQLFQKAVTKLLWKRCPRGTFAHSWMKNEICLFTLQKSVSGSSVVHVQIDSFTFFPSTAYKQLRTLSSILWSTTSYNKLYTLLQVSTSSSLPKEAKFPLNLILRIAQFVNLQHTIYSSSQCKLPIFITINFFP